MNSFCVRLHHHLRVILQIQLHELKLPALIPCQDRSDFRKAKYSMSLHKYVNQEIQPIQQKRNLAIY